jgi:hypothetical protein
LGDLLHDERTTMRMVDLRIPAALFALGRGSVRDIEEHLARHDVPAPGHEAMAAHLGRLEESRWVSWRMGDTIAGYRTEKGPVPRVYSLSEAGLKAYCLARMNYLKLLGVKFDTQGLSIQPEGAERVARPPFRKSLIRRGRRAAAPTQ